MKPTALSALSASLLALVVPASAGAVLVSQHALPAGDKPATAIQGWSGGLIVAGSTSGVYAKVTPGATLTVAPGPIGAQATAFTVGRDGNPWALGGEAETVLIQDLTPATIVTSFRYPGSFGHPYTPFSIALGSDKAFWIADAVVGAIDRFSLSGEFMEYHVPHGNSAFPQRIAASPNGALAYTTQGGIGEIATATGEAVERPIGADALSPSGRTSTNGIAWGPDGAWWFTEQLAGRIGRMTTTGALDEFTIPVPASYKPGYAFGKPQPLSIVAGPEQSMWYTDPGDDMVGRVTMSGEVTEYPVPPIAATGALPGEITVVGGELWFTESGASYLGSVNPGAQSAPSALRPVSVPPGLLKGFVSVSSMVAGGPRGTPRRPAVGERILLRGTRIGVTDRHGSLNVQIVAGTGYRLEGRWPMMCRSPTFKVKARVRTRVRLVCNMR